MSVSHSVVSSSLQPQGLYPARLLCPWNSPGKNIGVHCHSLLQGIFPTQGSNPGLQHCRHILFHLSHQGSPQYDIWKSGYSTYTGDLRMQFLGFIWSQNSPSLKCKLWFFCPEKCTDAKASLVCLWLQESHSLGAHPQPGSLIEAYTWVSLGAKYLFWYRLYYT